MRFYIIILYFISNYNFIFYIFKITGKLGDQSNTNNPPFPIYVGGKPFRNLTPGVLMKIKLPKFLRKFSLSN